MNRYVHKDDAADAAWRWSAEHDEGTMHYESLARKLNSVSTRGLFIAKPWHLLVALAIEAAALVLGLALH